MKDESNIMIMLKKILCSPLDATFTRQVTVFGFFLIINLISVILFNHFCTPLGYEYALFAESLLKGTDRLAPVVSCPPSIAV